MSKPKSSTIRRLSHAGLAAGGATALLAAMTASPAFAAAGTLALSSTSGASGGGNTLIATFATNPTAPTPTTFNASTTAQFVVQASSTASPICPTTYTAPGTNMAVLGTNLKVLSTVKLGVTVPTGVTHTITANPSTKWNLCVYSGSTLTSSPLVASALYLVGLKPTISVAGINPATGPALGGTTITVTGTNFVGNTTAAPNNTTATLGGLPLKDINVAGNGASFTATTPPHAPGGPLLLTVSTPGGTVSTLGATLNKANLFTFTNGIVISPNTASNTKTTPTDIDISGVGFSAMSFAGTTGTTPNSADAHVYLTNGRYNALDNGGGTKTNYPVTECTNVLVVSDTELLCGLNLSTSLDSAGAVNHARIVPVATTNGSTTITSDSGTFSPGDVGATISVPSDTQIAAATTITAVTNSTTATISAAAIATSTAVNATITEVPHLVSSTTTTTGGSATTITAAASTFSAVDVGKVITGSGIPANTTITAVSVSGATATISNAATAAATVADVSIAASPVPVPNDAYTLTVVNDGAVGANLTDLLYTQSIVSSGSTFTVADN